MDKDYVPSKKYTQYYPSYAEISLTTSISPTNTEISALTLMLSIFNVFDSTHPFSKTILLIFFPLVPSSPSAKPSDQPGSVAKITGKRNLLMNSKPSSNSKKKMFDNSHLYKSTFYCIYAYFWTCHSQYYAIVNGFQANWFVWSFVLLDECWIPVFSLQKIKKTERSID